MYNVYTLYYKHYTYFFMFWSYNFEILRFYMFYCAVNSSACSSHVFFFAFLFYIFSVSSSFLGVYLRKSFKVLF